ncbi:SPOR domain-containing protein [Thiomicrorhabdus sp. zzn3]|uniref:SPOR domain-containing protein n=1 Tax=Thiomicrorhabdus sp. zzn3 TaxID=3039775 RepID=UPI0024370D35|nr:SPOR domain-containing protein [Thiomicrorhabdus sp. zzn3]MDG6778343.1 SPOR domain-containing protein [Thiomicrorhabdus sp. zzn3]
MDEISKFRLTGAVIWLTLLVIIVPSWYSNPVNFQPEGEQVIEQSFDQPLVNQAYVLPSADGQMDSAADTNALTQAGDGVSKSSVKTQPAASSILEKTTNTSTSVSAKQNENNSGQWLLKVAAFKDIRQANRVLGELDRDYKVWIKEFPKTGTFSVRTGPYDNLADAERDKQKIDKALHTQSQIERLK